MNLIGTIFNSRYKIESNHAQSGMSYVYLARDIITNSQVAIKTFKSSRTSTRIENIIRFHSDIRTVSRLKHPSIVRIYDMGEFIGLHYLVMEYIEGETLQEIIQHKILQVRESLDIIIQLCRAVEIIHDNNIIHRDIKPSNILIEKGSGRVKLTDFGVAHIKEFNENMKREEIADAVGYISTELSGIVKRAIDGRSDLYSVGVILYRLLTGELPFTGNDLTTILHRQIASIPVKPGTLNPGIPDILDSIVLKLLEKEPENRYQSAAGLAADLEKIVDGKTSFILGLHDSAARLSFRTKLIGREKELGALKAHYDETVSGKGTVCFISGEAGTGKTRLVEELKEYVLSSKGLFLDGKCVPGDNRYPFSPFREIFSKYSSTFNYFSEEKIKIVGADLRSKFATLGRIITNLDSAMAEILGPCPDLPDIDLASTNDRFNLTVSRFIKRISMHEKSLVIVFDDLHDADDGTLSLLHEMMKVLRELPVMVVAIYRNDNRTGKPGLSEFLQGVDSLNLICNTITLELLGYEDLNLFVSGLLCESPDNTRDIGMFIYTKSLGNPFFTMVILQQLIDEKILAYSDNRWQAESSLLEGIKIPDSIVDAIITGFRYLDQNDTFILTYASIIGDDFDMELLSDISGIDITEIVRIIDKTVSLRILERTSFDTRSIRFGHDRIREAFYLNIRAERKKDLHLSLATAMEKLYGGNPGVKVFDLAHHFMEGGSTEKTIHYSFAAGLKAKENYAYDDAVRYFTTVMELQALSALPDEMMVTRCREELGDIYLTVGEYDRAIEIFQDLLPRMDDRIKKALVYKQITNVFYRKSNWKETEKYAMLGMLLLDEKVPLRRHEVVIGLVKELALFFLGRPFKGRYKKADSQKYTIISGFAESLSTVYALSDTLKFIRLNLRVLNLSSLNLGNSKELAAAYYAFASLCMAIPLFNLAEKYFQRSIAIQQSLNNDWGLARALELMGYMYEFQGKFLKAREYLNRGYELFQKVGDIKQFSFSQNGIEHSYYYMADYANAIKTNDRYAEMALKLQDSLPLSSSYVYYAQIHRETGDLEKSLQYARKAYAITIEKQIRFNSCTSLIELGATHLEMGEPEKAIDDFEQARVLNENNSFLQQYVIPIYFNLAQANIDFFVAHETGMSEKERILYKKKILKACRRAERKTRQWATHYGSALRVLANGYLLVNNHKKAEQYYLQSIESCEKMERRYEQAKCLYEYGLFLSQTNRFYSVQSIIESAYNIFSDIGADVYVNRLSHYLGINRENNEISSAQRFFYKEKLASLQQFINDINRLCGAGEFLSGVLNKAVELSGAQRGLFFIFNKASGKLELQTTIRISGDEENYPRKIVQEVFETGNLIRTINVKDDQNIHNYHSIVSSRLKSILCLPLELRGKIIGVCYLDNPLTSGIFNDEIIELLGFFFAGVSVEIGNSLSDKKLNAKSNESKIVTDSTKGRLEKALSYIENNYLSDISREGLASHVGINPDYFGKAFKIFKGKNLNEFINELRIREAANQLLNTHKTILDIAYSAGFESITTFRRAFNKLMKMSPHDYRNHKKKSL